MLSRTLTNCPTIAFTEKQIGEILQTLSNASFEYNPFTKELWNELRKVAHITIKKNTFQIQNLWFSYITRR